METTFEPMTKHAADAIVAWHYEEPYTFYDMQSDPDDLAAFLEPHNWEGKYYAVFDAPGELVGFFQFTQDGQTVEIGLGLRPDLTGRGLGFTFLLAGLDFAQRCYAPDRFRLAVATFNQRAIRVYERAGFRTDTSFMQRTNGGEYPFLRMTMEPTGLSQRGLTAREHPT